MGEVKRARWSSLEDETVFAPFINTVSSPIPPTYNHTTLRYTSYSNATNNDHIPNGINGLLRDNDASDNTNSPTSEGTLDSEEEDNDEDDDDDDDDDDVLFNGSRISVEAAHERKEWQQMLQSVLRGEVIKSEKKRLLSKDIFQQQRNHVQEIWLSLRALLRGRTIKDEIKYLEESRKTIDDVVATIMQFSVDPTDEDPPLIQVAEILKKIDRVESLYATRQEMTDAHPSYRATAFQVRLDALTAWCAVIRSLHMQSKILRDWTGSDHLQIDAPMEHASDDYQNNKTFVERILRESALQDTFDKRTLSALNLLLLKAKSTMSANSKLFQEMNLPSFVEDLHPLAHFPLQLVKEALKVRLASASSPPKQMADAMLEDCRGLLSLAFRVKQQYLELASPAPGWVLSDKEDLLTQYDAVIMDSIRWYFCLLTWKIDFEKENSLRECELLEKAWDFAQSTLCRLTGDAYFECIEQFYLLTNRQLQDVMSELNVITDIENSKELVEPCEIESRYTRVLHTTRMRARNLLQFAKFFMGKLENAAEYSFDTDNVEFLVRYLVLTNHVLVRSAGFEEERIYIIASPSLRHRPEMIASLAQQGFSAPTEDDIAGTPSIHDGYVPNYFGGANVSSSLPDHDYLLFVAPWHDFFWYGEVMEQEVPLVSIHLKPRRLRLVTRVSRQLKPIKSAFWQTVKHAGLTILREQRCHVPKIHKDIRRLKATLNKLATTIISSVYTMRDHTLEFGGQEFIEECFSFASDFGTRVAKQLDPRHRLPLDLSLIQLAIQWICFITDDCAPTDRRTFRWAVAALEFCQTMTKGNNMLSLGDADFAMLQSKVARCIALLISHFDVLGTRWKYEQQKEEQQRKRGITARRNSYITSTHSTQVRRASEQQKQQKQSPQPHPLPSARHLHLPTPPSTTSPTAGPTSTLQLHLETANENRLNSQDGVADGYAVTKESIIGVIGGTGSSNNEATIAAAHRYIRDAWMRNIHSLEASRSKREQDAKIIGKVLDDEKPEDRSLVYLAPSSSNFSFRWQQGRYIGSGTYGSVYLAINLDSSSIMAVKEIRFPDSGTLSTLHKAIKEEMKVMEMLHHHNIVEYYGMEVHREKVNIFMEYCENGSLGLLLKQIGQISEECYVVDYAYQLLSGIAYLHDNDIVHRDIKPDNILIDHQGQLKLTDFGASKIIKGQKTLGRTVVMTKSLAGTPMYMSPEAITGEDAGRNGSMDIWSLGCCVLQMVTGRHPWSMFDNEWTVMYHVVTTHPTLPTSQQMSKAGIHFLGQCFIHEAKLRPSAHELLQHPWITHYLEHSTIIADDVEFQFPNLTMPTTSSMPAVSPAKPSFYNDVTSTISSFALPMTEPVSDSVLSLPTPSTSSNHIARQSLSLQTPSDLALASP
ncbi:hypothetical protein DM01DRAFT_1335866 [Hesseltinella vesiculosa]|uniref:Protein kinase domain-containing protein n=1 Tax=Hesseltinella vesiculosa TaxID=101127 RepID=A0A1X2GHI9_9FUNG|nr:hypothetical protein DM01DRAFT_1335866 [Hesseltinella vesiculosa]